MKQKLIVVGIALALVIMACSKRTVATKDAGSSSTTSGTGTTSEPIPSESLKGSGETAVADVNLMASGKNVYETKCIRCHAMKPLAAFTDPRWDAILKIMVPKANLTQIETQQLTAYVKANAKR